MEAFGLTKEELNGQRGKVVGVRGERVEVDLDGVKALRPGNLKLVE